MILKINSKTHEVDVDPATSLLWVIRKQIRLTGTKFGCGIGQCGACTIHIDGLPTRSCLTPVQAAVDKEVTTIEGMQTATRNYMPYNVPGLKNRYHDVGIASLDNSCRPICC